MVITLLPPSGKSWEPLSLTGENPAEGMSSGEIEGGSLLDVVRKIEAGGVEVYDRGNEQNTLKFEITRQHATAGAAAFYWLHHLTELRLRAKAIVHLKATEANGTSVAEATFQEAGISGRRGTYDGCSTTFTYTITTGRISIAAGDE